eukprot:6221751-Amphidinium_carterae.1
MEAGEKTEALQKKGAATKPIAADDAGAITLVAPNCACVGSMLPSLSRSLTEWSWTISHHFLTVHLCQWFPGDAHCYSSTLW